MALPCKAGCPQFVEGCHKNCARWETIKQEQALHREKIREAKKKQRLLYEIDSYLMRKKHMSYGY